MERYEQKYNKLIGRQGDEYIFLDYLFKQGTFHGATGTRMRPISQGEHSERTDPDNIKDRYEDIWREVVSSGKTTEGLDEWVDMCIRIDGVNHMAYDTSYWMSEMWGQLREIGITEEEYPVIECTGGGRCFDIDMQWDELYDEKLWKLIQKYEDHPTGTKK